MRGLAATALVPVRARAAETLPPTIRFGSPQGFGRSTLKGGVIVGIANHKGWLQEEFGRDGVALEFATFKGGAPMVGQALANGQIDFAAQGDLMSVIGRSSGMKTRLILPSVKLGNAYVAVPAASSARSIQDLRGKRVAYFKGNYVHLQAIRILATEGMSERDIKSIYLDPASSSAALTTGDVDAVFGASDLLTLRDKGLARILYTTRDHSPTLTAQSGFLVREEFASRYPTVTQRIVRVVVRTARWMSDEANRQEIFDLWTSDRGLRSNAVEDYSGRPFVDRVSPLIDPFYVSRYKATLEEADQLGLLRGRKFDIDAWIDRRYLDQALRDLQLQNYWTPLDERGNRIAVPQGKS